MLGLSYRLNSSLALKRADDELEVFHFVDITLKKVVPYANQTITFVQVETDLSFFPRARVNCVEKFLILVVGKLNTP